MDTQSLLIILAVILVLVGLGLAIWAFNRKQRSQKLRELFGPEYEYTLNKTGDRRQAETELEERQKRVANLDIQSITPEEREGYLKEWQSIQARFVDEPAGAVKEANQLIRELMNARGFPMSDFDQRAADISVMYPDVVTNYRDAHAIAADSEQGKASTEDLRQAMVCYRSLFEELLETEPIKSKEKIR